MTIAAAFALLLDGASAPAGTVIVAANGVDGGACGAKTSPCRTITRAIANAGVDDTVVVGPGRYGDVNGNTSIGGADEEEPNVNGCGCILDVGKRVTVVSRDGASATIIDAGKTSFDLVRVSADGAQFGQKNKGFTLTRTKSGFDALDVTANDAGVGGHIVSGNEFFGYNVEGSRNTITASRLSGGAEGVVVTGDDNVITDTVATGTGNAGFNINSNRNSLRGVVAIGNAIGIALAGSGHTVTASTSIANTVEGIDVLATNAVITKTNVIGNSTGAPTDNCGIATSAAVTVTATKNYWGAATGPGADPADDACEKQGGTIITSPFATKEIKTAPKPLR